MPLPMGEGVSSPITGEDRPLGLLHLSTFLHQALPVVGVGVLPGPFFCRGPALPAPLPGSGSAVVQLTCLLRMAPTLPLLVSVAWAFRLLQGASPHPYAGPSAYSEAWCPIAPISRDVRWSH